jgi:hypothetical protein
LEKSEESVKGLSRQLASCFGNLTWRQAMIFTMILDETCIKTMAHEWMDGRMTFNDAIAWIS